MFTAQCLEERVPMMKGGMDAQESQFDFCENFGDCKDSKRGHMYRGGCCATTTAEGPVEMLDDADM